MLKKLKFAKNAAGFCAALCGILALLAANGTNTSRAAVFALVLMTTILAFVESRLDKRINAILLEEHKKLPINASKAIVVKSRVGHRYFHSSSRTGRVHSGPPMYYVTFEKESGIRMELYVPREVYLSAKEGKKGILRYKGDEFISFN